jgi:hypothetical protein
MICSAEPSTGRGLVCSVKENICNNMLCAKCALDEMPRIFVRDKPISSERMLHKDYYRKGSVGEKFLAVGLKGLDAKTN